VFDWGGQIRIILRKALTEPTPAIAGVQQLGALSILLSYATKDVIILRALAISGILFFNMVPNYFKANYLNIGWGFAFLGLNAYRLIELIREQTATAHSLGFTEDELLVYEQRFHRHITPRCFQRILKLAEWREVQESDALTNAHEMGILVRGSAELFIQGDTRQERVFQAKMGTIINIPQLQKPAAGVRPRPSSAMTSGIDDHPDSDDDSGGFSDNVEGIAGVKNLVATSMSSEHGNSSKCGVQAAAALSAVEPSPEATTTSAHAVGDRNGHHKVGRGSKGNKLPPPVHLQSSAAKLSTRALGPCKVLVWHVSELVAHLEQDDVAFQGLLQIFNEALLENMLERDQVRMKSLMSVVGMHGASLTRPVWFEFITQMKVNEKYSALVKRMIKESGHTLPAGQKMALSEFRRLNGVTDEMHNAALSENGWSREEYEWGAKRDQERAHRALVKLFAPTTKDKVELLVPPSKKTAANKPAATVRLSSAEGVAAKEVAAATRGAKAVESRSVDRLAAKDAERRPPVNQDPAARRFASGGHVDVGRDSSVAAKHEGPVATPPSKLRMLSSQFNSSSLPKTSTNNHNITRDPGASAPASAFSTLNARRRVSGGKENNTPVTMPTHVAQDNALFARNTLNRRNDLVASTLHEASTFNAAEYAAEAHRIGRAEKKRRQRDQDYSFSLSKLFSEHEPTPHQHRLRSRLSFEDEQDEESDHSDSGSITPPTSRAPLNRLNSAPSPSTRSSCVRGDVDPAPSFSSPLSIRSKSASSGGSITTPSRRNFVHQKSWSVDGKRDEQGTTWDSEGKEELKDRTILQRSLSAKLGADLSETLKAALAIRRKTAEAEEQEGAALAAAAGAMRQLQVSIEAEKSVRSAFSSSHASIADIFAPLRAEEEALAAAAKIRPVN
jgi:hypothetical protein